MLLVHRRFVLYSRRKFTLRSAVCVWCSQYSLHVACSQSSGWTPDGVLHIPIHFWMEMCNVVENSFGICSQPACQTILKHLRSSSFFCQRFSSSHPCSLCRSQIQWTSIEKAIEKIAHTLEMARETLARKTDRNRVRECVKRLRKKGAKIFLCSIAYNKHKNRNEIKQQRKKGHTDGWFSLFYYFILFLSSLRRITTSRQTMHRNAMHSLRLHTHIYKRAFIHVKSGRRVRRSRKKHTRIEWMRCRTTLTEIKEWDLETKLTSHSILMPHSRDTSRGVNGTHSILRVEDFFFIKTISFCTFLAASWVPGERLNDFFCLGSHVWFESGNYWFLSSGSASDPVNSSRSVILHENRMWCQSWLLDFRQCMHLLNTVHSVCSIFHIDRVADEPHWCWPLYATLYTIAIGVK